MENHKNSEIQYLLKALDFILFAISIFESSYKFVISLYENSYIPCQIVKF